MTPSELRSARLALGLSVERFAALPWRNGRIAASGRTVRRWERGMLDIPIGLDAYVRALLARRVV